MTPEEPTTATEAAMTPIIKVRWRVIKSAHIPVTAPAYNPPPTEEDGDAVAKKPEGDPLEPSSMALPSEEDMLSILSKAMDIVQGSALSPEEQAELMRQMMQQWQQQQWQGQGWGTPPPPPPRPFLIVYVKDWKTLNYRTQPVKSVDEAWIEFTHPSNVASVDATILNIIW